MPEIEASLALPWRDATSIESSVALPWRDAALLDSAGGPYIVGPPPEGGEEPPDPTVPAFVLPGRDTYLQVHEVEVIDLGDGSIVDFTTMTIAASEGAFCWTLTLEGGAELFARMSIPGSLPLLQVTINGIHWRFIVEGVRRTRGFADHAVSVTGRSMTALAGSPYRFEVSWYSVDTITAAQIVVDSFIYTGIEVRWLIDDWLVPARVWSFFGTSIAAAQRVAASVGAIVQSDPFDEALLVLPRYPVLPSDWSTTTPDVVIEERAVIVESYERVDQPAYDAVFVSGQQEGVSALVRFTGLGGINQAPMVTDLLLTEEPALRQRGQAVLGASGAQARVQLSLPVLTGPSEPGVLRVGQLIRVENPIEGADWFALVRAVSVTVNLPSVRQTVDVERHIFCFT